ncbi:NAD(P)H-hydrate dehydratase [Desulforhabdus amnigena]|uniref:NAD(P)H-hydrate dehydratase n=1 Tax=Desulforhabdus amnigena TaxID=40218 RepID=UPI0016B3AC5B|nr:NAD(P)H-hydrate dehydratase [Desulforhabdus amnigena]NLJ27594.1 NAD(P)H-hydrate dehydratase [Deltaproteobacteria bacterium]
MKDLKLASMIVTASEMGKMDRRTIEEIGIPGVVLMESAARGAASFFLEVIPDLPKRRITVVAGSGNNAGDGFVLARIFHSRGVPVRVVCLRSPGQLKGDALANFQILEKIKVPVFVWDEGKDFDAQWHWIQESDAIIDAILGTGLNSEVRGIYRKIIDGMNSLSVPVLAVDIPSGLDASTGTPLGTAVRATATATFAFPKIGHVMDPGPDYTGKLRVVDIGIPSIVAEAAQINRWWMDAHFLSGWLKPRRPDVHKGNAGHVAVLAGSRGKTGAATLICQGASRVGSGLVTLFVPFSLNPILEVKLTEAMTYPIAETDIQSPAQAALPEILNFLDGKQALAVGPGISLHPETQELVKALVQQSPCPMILDADALTIFAQDPELLKQANVPLILTPHPGEMARLIQDSPQAVQRDRLGVAAEFSRRYGVILVLKGYRTLVAAPDGRMAINGSGNPAMASGGMGDTLTGMIAGFVAQGYEPFQAACLGVYIHGAAADRYMHGVATRGLLASDILEEIPRVIGSLESDAG